jgi:membrane protease YdiL (CAAX protease family)
LEREGIIVSISNETLQGIVGEVAMGWSTSPRLMVAKQDAVRARNLVLGFEGHVSQAESTASDDSLTCFACGALMNRESVCPDCGWTYGDGDNEVPEAGEPTSNSPLPESPNDVHQGHDGKFTPTDILPILSDRTILPVHEVWFELAAVLCIGVIPNLANSLFHFTHGPGNGPYWANAINSTTYSLSVSLAVLYIIHRSGERWREFGFSTPRITDVVMALLLLLLDRYFSAFLQAMFPATPSEVQAANVTPVTTVDFALMSIMYVVSAFSEEVVMRAYLITRLRQLLHRPAVAVVVSGVLFALYHSYQGAAGLANALYFGLFLGSLFCIYPRIWPLMICHSLSNLWLEFDAGR